MNFLLVPLRRFLDRLRFPGLFLLAAGLMLLSWLWPFDPLPFIDEILTLLATVILARLRHRPAPPAERAPD